MSQSPSPEEISFEPDINWLKTRIEALLNNNRIIDTRAWNNRLCDCLYHAPLLRPELTPPASLLDKFKRNIALPWKVRYPHQWFWDSCLHSIVLTHLDVSLAKRELQSLLYAQQPDGFIPHMIWNRTKMTWVDHLLNMLYFFRSYSPYIQPPAIAESVERVYLTTRDNAFLESALPSLMRYYLYIDRERCPDGDGLAQIIISYESGKDRSPEYDIAYGEPNTGQVWRGPMMKQMTRHWTVKWNLRRILSGKFFRVKDLLFNSIYAANLSSLARLCSYARCEKEAATFREMALHTERSILDKMYDKDSGLFFSLDARAGDKPLKLNTLSTFMPLLLENIEQQKIEKLVFDHLVNPDEFWTPYPVPAEPLSNLDEKERAHAESYRKHIIWRGLQTWLLPNWYILRGLYKQEQRFPGKGFASIARELAKRSYELVKREGFCDYYHSVSGKSSGACGFGWSTIVIDMF